MKFKIGSFYRTIKDKNLCSEGSCLSFNGVQGDFYCFADLLGIVFVYHYSEIDEIFGTCPNLVFDLIKSDVNMVWESSLDETTVKLTETYETLLDNKSEGEYNPFIVDKVVDAVRKDLLDRSNVGICKYGTTLDGNDGDLRYWLQHAYEETLDKANYLKRAIMEIDNTKVEVKAFAKTKGY